MAQSVGAIALDIVMGKNTVSSVAKQAMADVQKTFNDGTATIGNKVSAVGQACTSIGSSLLPVSAAAQGVIATTANAAMSFETAMAQVKTIAGNASVSYKGSMTDMSKAIMQLSTDTGIAAGDVALATYNAISAGVDVSKSVEFVATANALAVGGFTDMTTSVDVLTTTLNAYGNKAGTAESISDKLITTQNLGKTTVNELASSMGKVIPTASAYGISIDNLCASYVAMTKGGIATAESTTYMKSMFNELADSGSTVGKILKEKTGKSFGQLMSEGKSLADVIDILGKSVNGDSEAFAQLWGSSEAGTGALAILNGGTDDFNNTLKEMGNSTGAASSAMDKMNETSAHKMQVAMNDMKNAAIELGGAFAPVMSGVASVVGNVARAFSNLPEPVKNTIAVITMIVAAIGPVLVVIGKVISLVGSAISTVGVIQGAIGAFTGFISGTVVPALSSFFAFLLANPIVLVITAIIAVIALLIANWDTVKQVTINVWNSMKEKISSAVSAIKTAISNAWNAIKTTTSNVFNSIKTFISNAWNAIKTSVSSALNAIKSVITTVWNAIKTAITTVLNAIKSVITNVWNAIKSAITSVVNSIKSVITTVWNAIKTAVSTAMNAIKSTVSSIWNSIKSTVSSVVNGIRTAVSTAFSNILSSIRSTMSNVLSAVKNGFNNVKSHITGLGSQAYTWGRDMIMGIVRGIKSCIGAVGDSVKGVANKIKSLLHFSRPDEGPLREYETWMPDFMDGLANGINANKYKVIDTVKDLASQMSMNANANMTVTAPRLKNVGGNAVEARETRQDDKLYTLLTQLVNNMQNIGNVTVPVYLGNDLIDEQIIKSNDRRTLRSGGRA